MKKLVAPKIIITMTTRAAGNAEYDEKSATGEKPPVMSELSTTEIVFAASVKPTTYIIAEKRRMYTVYTTSIDAKDFLMLSVTRIKFKTLDILSSVLPL
ncbi:hypothetical protein MNV_1690004 [Candidatus Methanoperedens nitroreducens]|uniref:Uncharacterized protein n=1 Tax=Candidatus Methanoperedens nitratireducens TaxID=1392998 RepID=A0A284VLQ2_9EURY|nr:hypothetical protein MNV_1690004 [Candidatus Methanoperedens nitroreducens]